MKRTQIVLIIMIGLLYGFNCINQDKRVTATLIRSDGKISVLDTFEIPDSLKLDLYLCISKFDYPPFIPQNLYWNIPDTSGFTQLEKGNLFVKYNFDRDGKLTTYYYQGSLVSGIFPLPYSFKYGGAKQDLLFEISDVFYKTKYRIMYDSAMNIQSIEKLDSTNKRIELLTIRIK